MTLLIGGVLTAPGLAQDAATGAPEPGGHAAHAAHADPTHHGARAGHAGHSHPAGGAGHAGHAGQGVAGPSSDTRQAVAFPAPLKVHTLANMRDHLLALAEIQEHLAANAWDKAAATAESRLGMASLQSHGAHEVARYMPEGMQQAGSAMHQAASRFARAATDASVTGDTRGALKALAEVSRTCVTCHAGYRFQ